ncbi:portal protein, partial [Gammaproteobacteria bacterium]|nr:portal protein [Gammaproteobacteria bacterium]
DYGIEFSDSDDLSDEFAANIWISSGKVVKAQLNPLPGTIIPYNIFPYEKNPHQFWGTGVPRMMRDSQTTMNAATRIYLDNVALSSGPMVEVNTDIMASGEDPTDLYPWRVFLREGGDGNQPMVRFYQPQSNSPALVSVIELFRRFADETTALPSYTHGQTQSSLNRTATGISILMSNANIVLKSVIKNIDDYLTKPMIRSLYDWNMTWNENENVKSDMRVLAKGSTALIQKEVQSQRLLQFLSLISNPLDEAMINREPLLRDIAKSLDIDPDEVIKTQEELMNEQALQQTIAAMQQGGQADQVPNGDGMVGPDARNGTPAPNGAGPVGNNGGLPL